MIEQREEEPDQARRSGEERPLEGRSVLVTGASRGIGAAAARALAMAGADLHLLARNRNRLETLARELRGTALAVDLTREDETRAALDGFMDRVGGPPDLVVNAAGSFTLSPMVRTELHELELNWEVNLRGSFLVIRHFLPAMLGRGSGRIVNIGSVAGRRALPGNAAYSASKFGVRGLHEVLLEEIRGSGVTATLLEPAACDTPLWDPYDPDADPGLPDRGSMLRPEDVAEGILFAATRPGSVAIPLLQIERG